MQEAIEFETTISNGNLLIPNNLQNWEGQTVKVFIIPKITEQLDSLDDIFGCINYTGETKTLEEMNQGILQEA
ncbi:hypothetical protein [Candidatus Albibeggiatoa sp. nov. NOAA]|uniref:hypothetical protein n=1 Tax=Candidatus Albibeggiatoa sp. nov. NOAA TaxID=3162724 RepID=UPI0032FB25CA|nr:hypothetical protein [Thiotrichaceae bacterium]